MILQILDNQTNTFNNQNCIDSLWLLTAVVCLIWQSSVFYRHQQPLQEQRLLKGC